MQQLPEEFNNASNGSDRDEFESDTIYEPINVGEREHSSRYSPKGSLQTPLLVGAGVFISILLNVLLIFASTERPFSYLAASFGIKNERPELDTIQQTAIDQLGEIVGRHTQQIAQFESSIKSLGELVSDLKSTGIEIDSKISRLESRVEVAVNEINKFKQQRVTPKPVAVVKAKEPPKPQIFVSLVSIRSQGGSQWVTLRDGLDVSPLIGVGDEWRAVKLISVDVNNKSAQIAINGTASVVKL